MNKVTVSYAVTAGMPDARPNVQLLMGQVWYGRTDIATAFAQAWIAQNGGGWEKDSGWPTFVTSLAVDGSSWEGITLGPPNGASQPAQFVLSGSGGPLGNFATATITPPIPASVPPGSPTNLSARANAS